jgi:hypothetical protein
VTAAIGVLLEGEKERGRVGQGQEERDMCPQRNRENTSKQAQNNDVKGGRWAEQS